MTQSTNQPAEISATMTRLRYELLVLHIEFDQSRDPARKQQIQERRQQIRPQLRNLGRRLAAIQPTPGKSGGKGTP